MSGAGSKGAYQAAVIQGLANYAPNPEVNLTWDVVTGVSAGSLNTLAMSVYKPEEVQEGAAFIIDLWDSIPLNNAYGNWPGGILEGLFKQGGIFDLSPGVEWVTGQLGNRTVNRKASFAATDSQSADYVIYDYNATGTQPDDIIEVAFASSSIPAAFPPTNKDGYTLVDGGVIWNLDVPSAVRRCKEIVDDEKDIIVDFIVVGNPVPDLVEDFSRYHTMEHFMRAQEINSFFNTMNDFNSSKILYPDVDFRYIVYPSEDVSTSLFPLDFSQKQIDRCYEIGKKDAKNAVKLGPGVYGNILLDYTRRLKDGEHANLNEMINQKLKGSD